MSRALWLLVWVLSGVAPLQADAISYNGFSVNGEVATVVISGQVRVVEAGEITLGSVPPELVWCLDLVNTLQPSGSFTTALASGLDPRIGGVMAEVPAAPTAMTAAQAQVAMWELEFGSAFTLNQINGLAPSAAFLSGVNTFIANAAPTPFTVLVPPPGSGNQEMGIVPVPVPAPVVGAGIPGLLIGLGLLVWRRWWL